MLDPRRLLTFRAVARAGSFSAAARELSLTQPAVSQQVAALERELGARLLHRGPGGLTLTEAGTVALDHADAVAERLALADAQFAELGDDRGALRVGGFPSALATLVPAAIASVVPQRVEAVEGTVEELAAWVADGSLHVAVLFQDAAAPGARAPGAAPPRAASTSRSCRRRPRAPARASAHGPPDRARPRDTVGCAIRDRHRAQRVRRRRLRARHRVRRARRARDPRDRGRAGWRSRSAAPHRRAPARRRRARAARRAARGARSTRSPRARARAPPRASSSTRCEPSVTSLVERDR